MTDGRTDGGDCNIPDAFLKKHGDNYAFLSRGQFTFFHISTVLFSSFDTFTVIIAYALTAEPSHQSRQRLQCL